jgi:hypothetical protein
VRAYVDWRREDAVTEPAPAPAPASGAWRRLLDRDRIASAGLFVAAQGLIAAYLVALHSAGTEALPIMLAASFVAVAVVALTSGELSAMAARAAWLVAGGTLLASVVPRLRTVLGLNHLTATLALMALAAAGFSVALALGGLRQLGSPPEAEERSGG